MKAFGVCVYNVTYFSHRFRLRRYFNKYQMEQFSTSPQFSVINFSLLPKFTPVAQLGFLSMQVDISRLDHLINAPSIRGSLVTLTQQLEYDGYIGGIPPTYSIVKDHSNGLAGVIDEASCCSQLAKREQLQYQTHSPDTTASTKCYELFEAYPGHDTTMTSFSTSGNTKSYMSLTEAVEDANCDASTAE